MRRACAPPDVSTAAVGGPPARCCRIGFPRYGPIVAGGPKTIGVVFVALAGATAIDMVLPAPASRAASPSRGPAGAPGSWGDPLWNVSNTTARSPFGMTSGIAPSPPGAYTTDGWLQFWPWSSE